MPYTGDPDSLGILHWLAADNPFNKSLNPVQSGIVEISPDHHYHVNYARSNEYARIFAEPSLTDRDCYFDPGVVTFSFPFHSIHPTGYTFRNGGGRGSVIRRWILEASTTPHGPWTTLRNHDEDNTFLNDVSSGNDKSLSFLGHAWPINISNDKWFSYFRLRNLQTHASSNRPYALYISGFELYGSVRATSILYEKG